MTIRCSEPRTQYQARQAVIDAAIRRVLDSGCYLHGEEVACFEREFAAFVGTSLAIGVSSGTSALWLALRACDVGPGDEVITCSYTAVATVAAIELSGATPVFVDVDPEHYTLDPSLLPIALTKRTKAIVPIHLYGQPADLTAIGQFASDYRLRVIEDCAQAHGARWGKRRVGSLGDAACFSFYPTKNLGALGDAGAVVTSDARIAEKARSLREYGWNAERVSLQPGGNARMDELQAAVLRTKLPFLDEDNAARTRLAEVYRAALRESPVMLPAVREGAEHVYHHYVVRAKRRDELQAFLGKSDILANVHYRVPVHLQPAYGKRVRCASAMDVTEQLAAEVLSLPIYPELPPDDVDLVARTVARFYSGS